MKNASLDYVAGHLRYGYLEGELEMTDEEFEKFKKNPLDFLYEENYINDLNLVIDNYEVNWIELTFI